MDASLITPLALGATAAISGTAKQLVESTFSITEGLSQLSGLSADPDEEVSTQQPDQLFNDIGLAASLQLPYSADQLEDALEKLQDRIENLLEDNGLKLDGDLRLTIDQEGFVRVKNPTAAKDKIEQLINENFETRNEVALLSSSISIIQAAERQQPFRALYEEDPEAAINQYGHLFDDKKQSHVDIILNDFDDPRFEESWY